MRLHIMSKRGDCVSGEQCHELPEKLTSDQILMFHSERFHISIFSPLFLDPFWGNTAEFPRICRKSRTLNPYIRQYFFLCRRQWFRHKASKSVQNKSRYFSIFSNTSDAPSKPWYLQRKYFTQYFVFKGAWDLKNRSVKKVKNTIINQDYAGIPADLTINILAEAFMIRTYSNCT